MNICIYGAASDDIDYSFIKATEELSEKLAKKGHNLVYGGGAGGLMGAAARGMTKGGGEICGVAPSFFKVDGVLYDKCTELIFTDTMRNRKAVMEERADAFIAVPGGIGTFDELFEILSLKQLGRHNKPITIYNINGYYDSFKALIETAVNGGFMSEMSGRMAHIFDNGDELINYLESYKPEECDPAIMRKVKAN